MEAACGGFAEGGILVVPVTDLVDYLRDKLDRKTRVDSRRDRVADLVRDLRQSATIMEPARAARYRELADHIERVLLS